MGFGFSQTWTYTLVTLISYPLITLALLFLLVRHLFLLYQHRCDEEEKPSKPPSHRAQKSGNSNLSWRSSFAEHRIHTTITTLGTPVFIGFALFSAAQAVITRVLSLSMMPLHCEVVGLCVGCAWWLAKGTIYSIFISRLHLAFKSSIYRYSVDFIVFLYLLNLLICTANLCSVYWIFCGVRMPAKQGPLKDLKICVLTFHFGRVGAFIVAINDVAWTMAFVYLFCRPLRALLKNVGLSGGRSKMSADTNTRLKMLPIKYTLLTLISALSTFLMVLLSGWFSASLFIVTDYLINSISLLLMTKFWSDWYNFLCGPTADWLAETNCCEVKLGSHTQKQLNLEDDVVELASSTESP